MVENSYAQRFRRPYLDTAFHCFLHSDTRRWLNFILTQYSPKYLISILLLLLLNGSPQSLNTTLQPPLIIQCNFTQSNESNHTQCCIEYPCWSQQRLAKFGHVIRRHIIHTNPRVCRNRRCYRYTERFIDNSIRVRRWREEI